MPIVEARSNSKNSGTPPQNMAAWPSADGSPPIQQKMPQNPSSLASVAEKRIDKSFDRPGKYEVSDESDFTIELFLKNYHGRWILMERADGTTENHKVVFRMWTYNEMVEMKKMATTFDLRKKVHELDNDLLNRLKIQRLLKSWTFGDSNERLRISHIGGVMTDESWTAFTRLQPNIAQYIIDQMNSVYEYNR